MKRFPSMRCSRRSRVNGMTYNVPSNKLVRLLIKTASRERLSLKSCGAMAMHIENYCLRRFTTHGNMLITELSFARSRTTKICDFWLDSNQGPTDYQSKERVSFFSSNSKNSIRFLVTEIRTKTDLLREVGKEGAKRIKGSGSSLES